MVPWFCTGAPAGGRDSAPVRLAGRASPGRLCLWGVLLLLAIRPLAGSASEASLSLSPQAASNLARLALRCVAREYPNKPDHVMNDAGEVQSPKALHPVFYGCYDWHSSVHGHWMLVRLLRLFPDLPEEGEIRTALRGNITAEHVSAEVRYLGQANRKSFERTYGWAWLLKLAEELHAWPDADGRAWSEALQPLTQAMVRLYMDFLPRQTYPIRTGVHPNTAFGIAFGLDYARAVGHRDLEKLLVERSRFYFGNDRSAPVSWEPGGEDFFSPGLMEADLMRRVLDRREFSSWLARFLPTLGKDRSLSLLQPALVSDRTDPKIVHLDGLNLSRAWCMRGIANSLAASDPRRKLLLSAAEVHARSTLPHIAGGHYEGEHWLGSFAVYLLSQPISP